MLFYIFLFLACVGILFFYKKDRALSISILLLWFVFAFRDAVGLDDGNYILAFDYLQRSGGYDIEWSYHLLVLLSSALGMNHQFVFIIYATLSYLFVYKALKLFYSNNTQRAVFIACFFGMVFVSVMSVMRQFLSAACCFYAAALLYKEGKILKPLLLCILATIFHTGAIIALPLLLFLHPKVHCDYKIKLLLPIVSVVIGYSGVITAILGTMMQFLPQSYQIYAGAISGSFSSAGGTLSWLLLLMFLFQCFVSARGTAREPLNPMQIALEKGQLIYLCLLFIFVHAGVASRLAFTFIIFSATIPITFTARIRRIGRPLMYAGFCTLMLVLFVMTLASVSSGNSNAFIPYRFSFDLFQ